MLYSGRVQGVHNYKRAWLAASTRRRSSFSNPSSQKYTQIGHSLPSRKLQNVLIIAVECKNGSLENAIGRFSIFTSDAIVKKRYSSSVLLVPLEPDTYLALTSSSTLPLTCIQHSTKKLSRSRNSPVFPLSVDQGFIYTILMYPFQNNIFAYFNCAYNTIFKF